jgi:6-phosphogluconate dehydrogenase
MQLGMIGLGRMGASLVRRLTKHGHRCIVFDVNPTAVKKLAGRGIRGAESIAMLMRKLDKPRAVWVMVPAGVTGKTVDELASHMDKGDIIIDGGNSYYRDDMARAEKLGHTGIHYVDCGTSGGVFGLDRGFCLMIGGEDAVVRYLDPIFKAIAPGVSAAPRTRGRKGTPSPAEQGYLHCGPTGAGHFVKMVHNGIEYGLMASYAEGLNILHNADAGKRARDADAETTPLRDAECYQYELNLPDIAEVWRRGSVISSWLLDLTATSLQEGPDLKNYTGSVSDSGEGRWTIAAAIDESVPAPVLGAALYERFSSRGNADFTDRLLSAMRKQFGGHDEKKKGKRPV